MVSLAASCIGVPGKVPQWGCVSVFVALQVRSKLARSWLGGQREGEIGRPQRTKNRQKMVVESIFSGGGGGGIWEIWEQSAARGEYIHTTAETKRFCAVEKPKKIPVFSPSHVGCRFAPSAPRLRRYAKN